MDKPPRGLRLPRLIFSGLARHKNALRAECAGNRAGDFSAAVQYGGVHSGFREYGEDLL